MPINDRAILQKLTEQYLEICMRPEQAERRRLWRQHNSLKWTHPLIYTRAFAWAEMAQAVCECSDPFLRRFENFFRYQIFWDSLGDDSDF